MKYRYTTQVMTRHSGMLVVYCRDREQAEHNVKLFRINREDSEVISFASMNGDANVMLVSEIIAVAVADIKMSNEVHQQDAECCKAIHEQVNQEFPEKQYDEEE